MTGNSLSHRHQSQLAQLNLPAALIGGRKPFTLHLQQFWVSATLILRWSKAALQLLTQSCEHCRRACVVQMHVHIARLANSLLASVITCAGLGLKTCEVDCKASSVPNPSTNRLDDCSYTTATGKHNLKVGSHPLFPSLLDQGHVLFEVSSSSLERYHFGMTPTGTIYAMYGVQFTPCTELRQWLFISVRVTCLATWGIWMQVTIKTQKSKPSAAQPFETAYGLTPDSKGTTTVSNGKDVSALVVNVPFITNTWAVVVNPGGPAEW